MGHLTTTFDQPRPSQDQIHLRDFKVIAIIGILPEERVRKQPIIVHITMVLDTEKAALSGDLSASVDYSQLAKTVAAILEAGRFRLLESAALALAHFVLTTAPMVTMISVHLSKPDALGGHGVPHVVVTRSRSAVAPGEQSAISSVIFACPGTSLQLVQPSKHSHPDTRENLNASDGASTTVVDLNLSEHHTLKILAYEV